MKKNLCFLNYHAGDQAGKVNECRIPVFDREKIPKTLNPSGDYTLDLIHDDVESRVIKDREKVENFIILNLINPNETYAKLLILRCFSIIKRMMPVLMQNKGSRIWIVHCPEDGNANKTPGSVMYHSLKKGFLSLNRVLALELGKRRIAVNSVEMKNLDSWTNFERFLNNLNRCSPFNMTAQEIKIEEKICI